MSANDEWTIPELRIEQPYFRDGRIVRDVHAPGWLVSTPAGPLTVAALREDRVNGTGLHDLLRRHASAIEIHRPGQVMLGSLVSVGLWVPRRWLPDGRLSMTTERLALRYTTHGLRLRTWRDGLGRAVMDEAHLECFARECEGTAQREREPAPWVSELIESIADPNEATMSKAQGHVDADVGPVPTDVQSPRREDRCSRT